MNDDNAADVPRTVHVCPGSGSRDVHITAWIDSNTSWVRGDEKSLGVGLVGAPTSRGSAAAASAG